ncbi:MAG: 4'-phosphopantetheinyl transferase superfamily protein [Phycisphaerales bacterium]
MHVVAWQVFQVRQGADRAETLSLGRAACRAALARAADLWRERWGDTPWHDAAFTHDDLGAPLLAAPNAPRISLCHARGLAGCAIAGPGHLWVGIDAERADAPGLRAVRELAERTGESSLPWPDATWPARLWCAKEAVVKAERRAADMLGRSLTVEALHPETHHPETDDRNPLPASAAPLRLTVLSHLGRRFHVRTALQDGFITASVQGLAHRSQE